MRLPVKFLVLMTLKLIQLQTCLPDSKLSPKSHVAVCFVGQFIRRGSLTRSIKSHFDHGFGKEATFGAFVSTSTQLFEEYPNKLLNSDELCASLTSKGFLECTIEALPYNGHVFLNVSKGLDFQLKNGLYPHRIASFFSTISRCLRMVRQSEIQHTTVSNSLPYHTHVMVTRLDVINSVHVLYKYRSTLHENVVVALHEHENRVDDRAFMGLTHTMLMLEPLFNETRMMFSTFLVRTNVQNDVTSLSPEALLYQFMRRNFPSEVKLLYVKDYISISHFMPWDVKYSPGFGEKIASGLNVSKAFASSKKCREIANANARSICLRGHMGGH